MSGKYASLPDIDTQPDVYETPDMPSLESSERPPRSSMYPGDILESSINPHASIERFKRATTKEEEEGVQRQRGLYRQYLKLNSGGDYVIGDRDDDGLKESVNSKLRRLMHEVKELGEQVQEVSADKDDGLEDETLENRVLLGQIQSLRFDLEHLADKLGEVTDENVRDLLLARQAKLSQKLLNKLKQPISVEDPTKNVSSLVTSKPELSSEEQTAKVAQMEARLAELEKLVGQSKDITATEMPASALTDGLMGAVTRMDAQLQLLSQPRQLEQAVKRIKSLNIELERLEKARSGVLSFKSGNYSSILSTTAESDQTTSPQLNLLRPEVQQRVERLFGTLEKLDPLLPLLPALLDRLRALRALHERALTFAETLRAVELEQGRLASGLGELTQLSKNLEQNFQDNQTQVQKNLEVVQGRMEEIIKRADALKR